ncbi:outer membrane protein assembly factor BamD [Gammaproteobacteria bacterium]|nr:outer membrane protein assembly factor BamD [Gammaproteobacteria bacterium]
MLPKRLIDMLCAGALLVLVGCSQEKENISTVSAAYQNLPVKQLKSDLKTAIDHRYYDRSLELISAIEVQYPDDATLENLLTTAVWINAKKKDNEALAYAADHYQTMYPNGQYLTYVRFIQAKTLVDTHGNWLEKTFKVDPSFYDIHSLQQAFFIFKDIVIHDPQSVYASYAMRYLPQLREMIANHELAVANYYYQRGDYLAAANRASEALQVDPKARRVQSKAAALLNKCYQVLGITFH